MKKTISLLMAAGLTMISCAVAEQDPDAQLLKSKANLVRVRFTTDQEETKAAFGEFNEATSKYPTYWTEADNTVAMSLNFGEPVEATVTRNPQDNSRAEFSANFEDEGSPYRFFALCPSSAACAASPSRSSWAVTIPTVQTPKADGLSCDESAMLLGAMSGEFQALPNDPIKLHFSHITTYCRLTLKNLSTAFSSFNIVNPTVKSVDLTFSVPVAGDWYVNAADGSMEEKEASHTITVRTTVDDLSQPAEVWFAMAPCTLDGATVKVSVNSDKGSLSRSYTYGTRTYAAGAVNKLSLDMTKSASFDEYSLSSEETVYELVKTANDINANDDVIFVDSAEPSYAMTASYTNNNGLKSVAKDAATGFTYDSESGYIQLPEGSTVAVMTVESKNSSNLTFKYGNNYLGLTTSGNTHYPNITSSSKTFTLYYFEDGKFALYYSESGSGWFSSTYYYSLYCDSSYFKMYSNTAAKVRTLAIYRKKTITVTSGIDPDTDPVLEHNKYGAYLPEESTTHTPHVTQLSREYNGNTLTFAILNPEENKVLEFNGIPANLAKGDCFTLSVIKVSGRKRTAVGDFSVTAIQESGAKIWLTDFNGNGFIVKR